MRTDAWAAADVFCSLSDNIQETFGITPIEAMAAGLPVIVSDWDGYKDTVRDGVDGFRVPTLLPQPGLGGDIAARYALELDSYDHYCGNACMLAAVDVGATAAAFAQLFNSPELRAKMGVEGRTRAQSVYDWAAIIPQYEALWEELSQIRRKEGGNLPALPHPWPARMDPFHAFATYPTTTLTEATRLTLSPSQTSASVLQKVSEMRQLAMVDYTPINFAEDGNLQAICAALDRGCDTVGSVVADIEEARRPFAIRTLSWLIKLGLITAQFRQHSDVFNRL